MGLLRRIWTIIMGWLGIGVSSLEDPEALLEAAQNELEEKLRTVKLQGVTAIQQKNQLEMILKDRKQELATLEQKVKVAVETGRDDLAETLMVEQMESEKSVVEIEAQFSQAVQMSDDVKKQVKRFEEEVQRKYQEKLRLRTQWKQAQITEKLNEALSGISTAATSDAFDRAKEKIQEKQARAAAITEMGRESVKSKIAELDADVARQQAKERLAKMKAEMAGSDKK
ncbi:MAG: PspA/IM30 family protein [Bacillota bacterium]|jgi:phage shock protein A|nr:PspA/IM30 family protein [Bacillota bacterium]